MPVTILSWNTHFGGGTAAAIRLARKLGADAVLLQEATVPDWQGAATGAIVPGQPWGSWVLMRTGAIESLLIAGYDGWVSGGLWTGGPWGETGVYLFSIHSPTSSEGDDRGTYVAESKRIVEGICGAVSPEAPLVIGGDFNFTSFGLRQASESIRNTAAERAALEDFRSRGFSLAWPECHPGSPLPQTLRWASNPSVPYHPDGFLVRGLGSTELTCEVVSGPLIESSSDHNPVLLAWCGAGWAK